MADLRVMVAARPHVAGLWAGVCSHHGIVGLGTSEGAAAFAALGHTAHHHPIAYPDTDPPTQEEPCSPPS